MPETNRKKETTNKSIAAVPRTRGLAGVGIGNEAKINGALDAIFNDLADDRADYEKTRYMLSAIGKKLSMEHMKIRAGLYKGDRGNTPNTGFFLTA